MPFKKLTQKEFIEKANLIHNNKYDYSLVEYKNSRIKIKIICLIHGEFEQKPQNHLDGHECFKCGLNKISKEFTKSLEQFKIDANIIHNNFYNYDKFVYKCSKIKGIITCPKHGDFLQTPSVHLCKKGCPKCNRSKGEINIENYLINNKIKYIEQYKFNNCKNILPLKFDFFLPDYNMCIEFQGEQHYKIIPYWGGKVSYKQNKQNDQIKKDYCLSNNIKLIEIPYWDIDKIDQILSDSLSSQEELKEA